MYIPHDFREERIEVLHELMRSYGFATLVTLGQGSLDASHIPMLLNRTAGPYGQLTAHVARGNPQWKEFAEGVPALALFSGPHHYISPSWYPSTKEHGKMVPTWNYAVVHAHGRLCAVEDREWLRRHVEELVAREEARFAEPWKVADAPEKYIDAMLGGIVGLELTIDRLEGKWKLGQNRLPADREGAIAGLRSLGAEDMAELMEQRTK